MNVLIGLIILSAFLQSSFIGINLVLLLITVRSFIVDTRANYFLAFFAGLLVGILSAQNIGFWPIIYMFSVLIAQLLRKLPFNRSLLTVLPVVAVVVLFAAIAEGLVFSQSINGKKPIFEILSTIPIYLFLNFWEDRFMVHTQGVKLKLRR